MISTTQVLSLIQNKLEDDNVFIVELKISALNQINLLIDSDEGINISYCVDISRLIEHNLDREIEDFELEVSSPGVGPFRIWRQYKKYLGKEVLVKKDGVKPQKGLLKNLEEKIFTIEFSEKVKQEGKKKKIEVIRELSFLIDEVASVEPVIKFKE